MGVLKVKDATGAWVPIGVGVGLVDLADGTYTPTLTGIAVGGAGATNTAFWQWIGSPVSGGRGIMHMTGNIILGTGATLPSNGIKIGYPAGFALSSSIGEYGATCQFTQTGVEVWIGYTHADPAGINLYFWLGTPATAPIYPRRGQVTAASPFTWKVTDQITWSAHLAMTRT